MERIRSKESRRKVVTPEEAAAMICKGMTIGCSGFTASGYPKAFPLALAKRDDARGLELTLITGASVGDDLDGVLARAGCVARRYPYQTNDSMRDAINSGNIKYTDIHLGQVPHYIKSDFLGKIDYAVIEAIAITEEGNIVPSTSVGCSDELVKHAEKVIIEINTSQPEALEGMHDIYTPARPPYTQPIPITSAEQRIGTPYIPCPPEKIAAVIFCDIPDSTREMKAPDDVSRAIAANIMRFLKNEIDRGRLPVPLPPIQSGVGEVSNAVLEGFNDLGPEWGELTVYTEVMQDAVAKLIASGKVKYASGTALTLSPSYQKEFFSSLAGYRDRIILRPVGISNSAEIIRRLGLIAMNTALEADLSGNVNSTHVGGTRLINGIGGSGDFARNAGLTIFTTASTAKNGTVSCIVPTVSHVDHTEHDVHIIVTEFGTADLRGLDPAERAVEIIENCAHPKFRRSLYKYLEEIKKMGCQHGLTPKPAYCLEPDV